MYCTCSWGFFSLSPLLSLSITKSFYLSLSSNSTCRVSAQPFLPSLAKSPSRFELPRFLLHLSPPPPPPYPTTLLPSLPYSVFVYLFPSVSVFSKRKPDYYYCYNIAVGTHCILVVHVMHASCNSRFDDYNYR